MTADPPLGLRERKKIKLRRSVQQAALRLFAEQGYDQTTVEQIADAADISTTTFYRYFPTKEDTVLDDDYDAHAEEAFRAASEGSSADALTAAVTAVAAAVESEREEALSRLRLFSDVPALRARQGAESQGTNELFARLLAERTGRPNDDYRLRIVVAAVTAAMVEASHRWAETGGRESLSTLTTEAIAVLSPLIDEL